MYGVNRRRKSRHQPLDCSGAIHLFHTMLGQRAHGWAKPRPPHGSPATHSPARPRWHWPTTAPVWHANRPRTRWLRSSEDRVSGAVGCEMLAASDVSAWVNILTQARDIVQSPSRRRLFVPTERFRLIDSRDKMRGSLRFTPRPSLSADGLQAARRRFRGRGRGVHARPS